MFSYLFLILFISIFLPEKSRGSFYASGKIEKSVVKVIFIGPEYWVRLRRSSSVKACYDSAIGMKMAKASCLK